MELRTETYEQKWKRWFGYVGKQVTVTWNDCCTSGSVTGRLDGIIRSRNKHLDTKLVLSGLKISAAGISIYTSEDKEQVDAEHLKFAEEESARQIEEARKKVLADEARKAERQAKYEVTRKRNAEIEEQNQSVSQP